MHKIYYTHEIMIYTETKVTVCICYGQNSSIAQACKQHICQFIQISFYYQMELHQARVWTLNIIPDFMNWICSFRCYKQAPTAAKGNLCPLWLAGLACDVWKERLYQNIVEPTQCFDKISSLDIANQLHKPKGEHASGQYVLFITLEPSWPEFQEEPGTCMKDPLVIETARLPNFLIQKWGTSGPAAKCSSPVLSIWPP